MDIIEKECRQIAKQKELLIRKNGDRISVYYTVTIRRQSRTFDNWEKVLEFVKKFNH